MSATSKAAAPPSSKVAEVERLLQVLAVLRHSETDVTRSVLVDAVHAYTRDDGAARQAGSSEQGKAFEALEKKIRGDMKRLRELGFQIEITSPEGLPSTWVLRPVPWRVPLDLTDQESAVLSWAMRTAGQSPAGLPEGMAQSRSTSTVGEVPGALGRVHAALAGGRALVVERDGKEQVIEPAQLASFEGRWYLLARHPGSAQLYGYRLDRLEVVAVGDPLAVLPERVEDPRVVLDPTAWEVDPPLDVELRCSAADRAQVASWFPRCVSVEDGNDVVLTFRSTHTAAVLDRVLGLAGAARLVGPPQVVDQLRTRLLAFTGGAT